MSGGGHVYEPGRQQGRDHFTRLRQRQPTNAISNDIVVSPAAASQLVIDAPPSSQPPRAGLRDPAGGLRRGPVRQPGDRRQQHGRDGDARSGTGPLQGTTSATVGGRHGDIRRSWPTTGETISLKFSSGSPTSAISNTIVDQSGDGVQLVIHTQPSIDGDGRAGFGSQPVI